MNRNAPNVVHSIDARIARDRIAAHGDRSVNRRTRRAIAARKRTPLIRKHTPFGRIVITEFVVDIEGEQDRIEYTHMGKGKMSRVLTDQLLFSLQV